MKNVTHEKTHSVSLCFACFNEEETITEVLLDADRIAREAGLDYEIIVCDDGSVDDSMHIIRRTAEQMPHLRILEHQKNRGIFATYEHLYAECRKEFIFLNSADKQYSNAILLDMLPYAGEYDMIVGTRKKKYYGPLRSVVSWGFNFLPQFLFGVNVYDAGALKLVRREIIEKMTIVSRSPFSEAERIIRATRAGYRVRGIPVEVRPRKTGHSTGVRTNVVSSSLTDLWRVWYDIHMRPLFRK